MKVVYVAGPYRAARLSGRLANILKAWAVSKGIWEAGHVALCPHLNTALMCEETRNTKLASTVERHILRGDLELLSRCDALRVLPNWEKSTGTLGEIKHAQELGIPVFYNDFTLGHYLAQSSIEEKDNDGRDSEETSSENGSLGTESSGSEGEGLRSGE